MNHISKDGFIFEDLEVDVCEYPWKHVICTSPSLKKLCKQTYEFHMQFNQLPAIINGELQANSRSVIADPNTYGAEIASGQDYALKLFNYLGETYFSNKLENSGKWHYNVCESTMIAHSISTSSDFNGVHGVLYPHNDDPVQILEENRRDDHGGTLYDVGKIKLVLYTGDDSLNYDNYGTKLYKRIDSEFELPFYDGFEMIKEINYINGSMLMWAPGPDTWHGTDFCSHLENRRIFYTGEYYTQKPK